MSIVLQFAIYPGLSMIYTVKKETYSNTPAIKKKNVFKMWICKIKICRDNLSASYIFYKIIELR